MKKILGALALLSLVLTAANGQTVNANVQKSTTTNQLVGKNVLPAVQGIVTQTNSFTVGTCLYNDGTGSSGSPHYSLSDNHSSPIVNGVIVQAGTASLPTVIQFLGYQNTITGLASNTQYYLGSSGALTSVAPNTVGYYVVPVMLTGIAGDGEIQISAPAEVIIQPVVNGGTGITTATAHGVLVGETTSPLNVTAPGSAGQVLTSNGGGADPTFQSVGGSQPLGYTYIHYTQCDGSGGALGSFGLNLAVDGTQAAVSATSSHPLFNSFSTGASANTNAGFRPNAFTESFGPNPEMTFRMALGTLSSVRFWGGLSYGGSPMSSGTGIALQNFVGFRYDTSQSDVDFMCVCYTGTSITATDSTIAADTNFHIFQFLYTSSSVKFYIDGNLVATVSTNVPPAENAGTYLEIQNLTATNILFNWETLSVLYQ